jgi:hypothetical protein
VDEHYYGRDRTVVNKRQAEGEQEVQRRAIEKQIEEKRRPREFIAPELRDCEVQEDGEQDKDYIEGTFEERQDDKEAARTANSKHKAENDKPLLAQPLRLFLRWLA